MDASRAVRRDEPSSCHTDTVLCIDGVRTLAAGGRRWLLDTDDVLDTTSVMS